MRLLFHGILAFSLFVLAACAPDSPVPPSLPSISSEEMIRRAEQVVEDELPDIPLWEGVKVRGSLMDESTVCVDRFYREGGGLDGKGGSAGYVVVSFPGPVLHDPQDGLCQDGVRATPSAVAEVSVPADLRDEPGLVTRVDLGEAWPLTVDYGLLRCVRKQAGRYSLQLVTFIAPDGREYALNGHAKSHTNAEDIDVIWAPSPAGSGVKKSMAALTEKGLTFC